MLLKRPPAYSLNAWSLSSQAKPETQPSSSFDWPKLTPAWPQKPFSYGMRVSVVVVVVVCANAGAASTSPAAMKIEDVFMMPRSKR